MGAGGLGREDTASANHHDEESGFLGPTLSESNKLAVLQESLRTDIQKQLVGKVQERRERVAEVLPPPWFLPPATFKRHQTLEEAADMPTVQDRPLKCGEKWLTSPIFQHLDHPAVRMPIYGVLGSMVVLQPALILGLFADGSPPHRAFSDAHPLPLMMHAIGAALLWVGVLCAVRDLRRVVRQRTSWLRSMMDVLGVDEREKENAKTRAQCTALIADQCDRIERQNEAMCLCLEAESALRQGDQATADRKFRDAEALDPHSLVRAKTRAVHAAERAKGQPKDQQQRESKARPMNGIARRLERSQSWAGDPRHGARRRTAEGGGADQVVEQKFGASPESTW